MNAYWLRRMLSHTCALAFAGVAALLITAETPIFGQPRISVPAAPNSAGTELNHSIEINGTDFVIAFTWPVEAGKTYHFNGIIIFESSSADGLSMRLFGDPPRFWVNHFAGRTQSLVTSSNQTSEQSAMSSYSFDGDLRVTSSGALKVGFANPRSGITTAIQVGSRMSLVETAPER